MAAVKNYHKLDGLKPHTLFSYSSGGYKSEINFTWLKSRYWQVWFLLEVLENLFPCLLQCMSYILCIACLMAPSSIFKVNNIAAPNLSLLHCCHMAFSLLYSLIFLCLPLIRILIMTFRAHTDNPE